MTATTVATVPLDAVTAGDNDRTTFDPDELEQLATSIATHGLAQPPTVRPRPDGTYQLVAGERRVRAVRSLGWATVPALVRELDDQAAADIMLAENTARADLDPIEEAHAYQKRIDRGATAAEVARVAGVSTKRVTYRVQLLDLVDEAQQLVRTGSLSLSMSRSMSVLDANRQRVALRALARTDLTHQAFTELVAKLKDDQDAERQVSAFDLDAFLAVQEYRATATPPPADTATREDLVALVRRLADEVDPTSGVYAEALAAIGTPRLTIAARRVAAMA